MTQIARDKTVSYWCNEIDMYEREFQKWEKRGRKIVKRYKDERGPNQSSNKAQFNILWSNVQTLAPALYASPPKPNIDRTHNDKQNVGRTVAQILEKCVTHYVKTNDFNDVMTQTVLDRLLAGRGTSWERYVPNFKDAKVEGNEEVSAEGVSITEDVFIGDDAEQELLSEDVVSDYVAWEDFGHSWGRTWQEVPAVWRKVYLDKKQLSDRFGEEIAKNVPLDAKPAGKETDRNVEGVKATVYEIWCKTSRKAYWINKSVENVLDERDDPLKLQDFFPCPKPLYATLANDGLVPSPDFTMYQDQARELDVMTARIDALIRALKVAGVYDKNAEGVDRLLSEGAENVLIPVTNWALLGEKGGMAGVVDWFPIEMVVNTLAALYESRERCKQDIYEITGISDIIRGATDPNETLGAQELKGKFATLRLDNMQKDVARYSCDLVRIKTEIIAENFSIETIKQLSGVKLLTNQEKAQAQMMAQQVGPEGEPQPIPEEIQELLDLPTWEEVEAILRDNVARSFKIDIETDSTIKTDQEAEKAARMEFLTASGSFIQQMIMVPNPELQPLLMEMLMFGVRGFKIGREMEASFDSVITQMKRAAENPAPPPPDPAVEAEAKKAELEGARLQQDGQIKQVELQQEGQFRQAELSLKEKELSLKEQEILLKARDIESKYDLEDKRINSDMTKARMDAKTKASPDVAMSDEDMNEGQGPMAAMMMQLADALNQGLQALAQIQAQNTQATIQGNQAVIEAIQNPAPRKVIRDAQGNIAGVQ